MKKNLLEMVPHRVEYEWKMKEGKVVVFFPRLRSSIGKKFLKVVGKDPTYRLKLDPYCSFIWELCDGKKNVEKIGKAIKERFGEEVEPLYPRLSKFLEIMERNRLIKYENNRYE